MFGLIERGLRKADAARGDVDAAELESSKRMLEPEALLPADQPVGRNDIVLEHQFGGVDALVAQLLKLAADLKAIAFFGDEIAALGESFFPPAGNEEEWFSAILPAKLNRPARIFGDLLVSHFSFYTQERHLLQTDILDRYYALAGLPAPDYERPVDRKRLKDILRPWRRKKSGEPSYEIFLREPVPA